MYRLTHSTRFFLAILAVTCAAVLPSHAWQPSLYPANWTPPESASFATGAFIQDFSYAGYRRGEEPVPEITGPVFDAVATFGADPTGASDSTAAAKPPVAAWSS